MKYLITFLTLVISLVYFSCESERITPSPTTAPATPDVIVTDDSDTLTNPIVITATGTDAFMTKLRKAPTRKTISSYSDLPFIGEQGTRIWIYPYQLSMQDGSPVSFPVELEILELYEPGEMIAFNAPTTSGGELLVSGGEFRICAFKDGQRLKFNPNNGTYRVNVPILDWTMGTMELFEAGDDDAPADWDQLVPVDSIRNDSTQPRIISNQEEYLLDLDRMGWINCDYFYNYPGGRTRLTFTTLSANGIKGIKIFIHFPAINSIMSVWGPVSGPIPIGDNAEIIAIGATDDETSFYDYQEITIEEDIEIELDMKEISEEDFQDLLDGL